MLPSKKGPAKTFVEAGISQSLQTGASFLCPFSRVGIGICTLLCCPSPLLSGSTLPSPPSLCEQLYCTVYTYTVCKGGGGVWSSEPQTDKHLPQRPFTGQFFYMTTFCFGFYKVNQTLGFNHLGGKSLHGHEAELVRNILIPKHIILRHSCLTESDLICS